MAKNSKEKGKRYERQVAAFLSDAYNESFTRVPHSGAFVGGKNASRRETLSDEQSKVFCGDIIPPENWNIVIECKNYEKISGGLAGIIKGNSPQVNKWLKELRGDAGELVAREKLFFHILFLKITRVGEWVIVPIIELADTPHTVYLFNNEKYYIYDIMYFDLLKSKIKERS